MIRWPTKNDDYICIDCLRKEFEEQIKEAGRLLTQGQNIVDRQMTAIKALESENIKLNKRNKFLRNKRKAGWS